MSGPRAGRVGTQTTVVSIDFKTTTTLCRTGLAPGRTRPIRRPDKPQTAETWLRAICTLSTLCAILPMIVQYVNTLSRSDPPLHIPSSKNQDDVSFLVVAPSTPRDRVGTSNTMFNVLQTAWSLLLTSSQYPQGIHSMSI